MQIPRLRRLIWWIQGSLVPRGVTGKVRYIACSEEVTVTRDHDFARIEYKEKDIAVTLLQIGPELWKMSDGEIVDLHNEGLRNEAKQAAKSKRVAVEVPLGSAQIKYFTRCDQWVPRGDVLRCQIQEDKHGRLIVKVDEQNLRLKQFGKLLAAYEGWGMRIEFVPREEVYRRPVLEVREPQAE